jgi:hypothetical protein
VSHKSRINSTPNWILAWMKFLFSMRERYKFLFGGKAGNGPEFNGRSMAQFLPPVNGTLRFSSGHILEAFPCELPRDITVFHEKSAITRRGDGRFSHYLINNSSRVEILRGTTAGSSLHNFPS